MTYLYIKGGSGAEHADLINDLRAAGPVRIRNSDYASSPEQRASVVYTDSEKVAELYEGRAGVYPLTDGSSDEDRPEPSGADVQGVLQPTGAGWYDVTVEGQTEKARGEAAAVEKAEAMGATDIKVLD